MGRLFWKFFLAFWLAQVITVLGVGITFWTLHPERLHRNSTDLRAPSVAMSEGVSPPREKIHPQRRHRLFPTLPIIAGSIVSLIFAALLAWYFAQPIRALRKAFDNVANGRFDTRIGTSIGKRKDELAGLGQDFDRMASHLQELMETQGRMASRMQKLMEAQQRLLHDVSHEIRSPLARLQAAADLMLQQPERTLELIPRMERDTNRIDVLVGELLTLTRLDSGMAGRMDEQVDLHELLEHIANDARLEAEGKMCAVESNLPEKMVVKGNHELLYRALENVVRNAVAHSPAGTRVTVNAENAAGQWLVTVEDEGSGVLPSELENIFQPFFRGQAGSHDGYGLGLAITKRVVQAHGGTVQAENRKSGGLSVTISLSAVSKI